MKLFDLRSAGPEAGDCTAPYDLRFYKPITVGEFINEVLKRHEWGTIYIYDPNDRDNWYRRRDCSCEYRWTELKSRFPEDILNQTIKSASAHGGWSAMDYVLTLEGTT